MKIVFFSQSGGSGVQTVVDAIASGSLNAEIAAVVTTDTRFGVFEKAQSAGIPVVFWDENTPAKLEQIAPDLIFLWGWLRLIPQSLIEQFPGRIVNIHPALLPKYGGKGMIGKKCSELALENGDTEAGSTIHAVTAKYDEGAILDQIAVPVQAADTPDTLFARVLDAQQVQLVRFLQSFSAS